VTILIIIKSITYFLKLKKNITEDNVMKDIDPHSIT